MATTAAEDRQNKFSFHFIKTTKQNSIASPSACTILSPFHCAPFTITIIIFSQTPQFIPAPFLSSPPSLFLSLLFNHHLPPSLSLHHHSFMASPRHLTSHILPYLLLILCFFPFHVVSMLDPLHFLALQSIRKSLKDLPGSSFFSSWDFTSDPCSFSGVLCSGDKVIALNLGDSKAGSPGLTGRLHPDIGKLSSLADLTVVPGRLYGPLPPSLSDLSNLRFLGVSRNFLSGDIPPQLGRLKNLRTLDLSYNQLAGKIPPAIGALPELTNLILCHNHLSGSVPEFSSKSLTRLDLKHNSLTGSIGSNSLPSSLQYLSLSWNNLTGPVDRVLNRMDRLSYLDLSLNRFTGVIPPKIFTLPLTSLQLERNRFSGSVEPVNQVMISTVDLSHNEFTGEVSPMFSTVENLYLNNNRFSGRVPGCLVDRLMEARMQILYLQHNYLTHIEISPTAEIPVSSSLCIQYNCMVPPIQTPCPLRSGKQITRPTAQCNQWRRG